MAGLCVRLIARPRTPRALAVVLHGGRVASHAPTHPWQPAVLRMDPIALALRRFGRSDGLAVAMVRYRERGWNADDAPSTADRTADAPDVCGGSGAANGPDATEVESPARLRDAQEALAILAERLGPLPTALVGHSMGGRAALLCGGHPQVRAVVGLAPWIDPGDGAAQLADRDVLLIHGDADRITDPRASGAFADRAAQEGARASYIGIDGGDHAMLRRARLWHRLTTGYVGAVLLGRPPTGPAGDAVRDAALGGARITLGQPHRGVPDRASRAMIGP